jgi:hypothetical protein
MKRPTWLSNSISLNQDIPNHPKGDSPVLISISETTKHKNCLCSVEVDFINRPSRADAGTWAHIDFIAMAGRAQLHSMTVENPAFRGGWVEYRFTTRKAAFLFAQHTLLFIQGLDGAGIGLIDKQEDDPREDVYRNARETLRELQALTQHSKGGVS